MDAFDSAGQDLVRAFVDMPTAEWDDEIKYLQPFGVQWLEHATVLDSEEEVDDLGDDLLDDIGDALDNELPCGGSACAGGGAGTAAAADAAASLDELAPVGCGGARSIAFSSASDLTCFESSAIVAWSD